MIDHFNLPLGSKGQFKGQKTEVVEEPMSSFDAGFASSRLEEGKLGFYETVDAKAREDLVKAFPDYTDNQSAYDAYLGIDNIKFGPFSMSQNVLEVHRKKYTNGIKDNIFELDENNNIVEGSGYNMLAEVLFDRDTMRGFLLSQKNGLNDDVLQAKYQEIVKSKQKEISEAEEGIWGNLGGALTGYLASQETLSDFASPGKIMASSVAKGFVKATGVEAAYIAAGETMREEKRRSHAQSMDEERTLWDGTKEILINSGFGGLIRGIGSAIWDTKTMRDIHKRVGEFEGVDDALTDKQIFNQFAIRENQRLNTNTNAHYRVLDEAEFQMEQGKKVDVSEALDIPIESKLETEETTNILDEIDANENVIKDKEFYQVLDNEIDELQETDFDYFDEDIINTYKEDARLLDDEESQILMKEIEELDTGSKEYGEQIEASEIQDSKFKAQEMYVGDEVINKTDFDLIKKYQNTREWNRNIPEKKRPISKKQEEAYLKHSNIADDLKDMDFTSIQEVEGLFSKLGDNLAAGTIAGVETDEEGNITFSPEKFVMGLGGYSAVKAMYKSGYLDDLPEVANKWAKDTFGVDIQPNIIDAPKTKVDVPKREEGESLIKFIERKKEFYKENPDIKPPKLKQPKKIIKPSKEEVGSKFEKMKDFDGYSSGMKSVVIDKPYSTPKEKIYRGESDNSGYGLAMFGSGLYSTTSRKQAEIYGKIREVSISELPKNPIQFDKELDFKQFEYELAKALGLDKRDIFEYLGNIDEYLIEMGYDGLTVGKGKQKMFVTFPQRKGN